MNESSHLASVGVKRRQYVLLGAFAVLVIGAALVSVSLTRSGAGQAPTPQPRSTPILAPGAQVDPRDAWRGQADAQLKSIEQRSREIHQRNAELETQSKAMLERLKKLEEARLTPLPPPPVAAPAARPNFGPDRPSTDPVDLTQRLPPPPPPRPASVPTATITNPSSGGAAPASGILSITLADGTHGKTNKTPERKDSQPTRSTGRYIPSGAFTRAILLGGLDAPTGGQSQRNPQPVLLRPGQ